MASFVASRPQSFCLANVASPGSFSSAAAPTARELSQVLSGLQLARQLSHDLLERIGSFVAENVVSGPQGSVRPFTIVDDPSAWKAADWAGRESEFVLQLHPEDVTALKQTVADMEAAGRPLTALKRPADFPLPAALAARLAAMKADLLHGRGFALVRGMPVKEWSEWQCLAAYMGIGAHLGYRGPQSKDGKLVNHVKMVYPKAGAAPSAAPSTRPMREHAHNLEFGFHTDAQADVLGLLCIRQAREGGVSGWSSTLAVINQMLAEGRADLVQCLAGPGWYRDRARYQDLAPGDSPVWEMPVVSYHDGRMTVHYNAAHYRLCANRYYEIVGQLTPSQLEAISMFEEIAGRPDFKFEQRMQPGDALFLNNSAVLHARSAFKDGDSEEERRHLVRLWLAVEDEDLTRPAHLDFPRNYSTNYDHDTFVGLMHPDPDTFHVPLSCEADDV
eukprot:CAMPEP_0202899004 /NCGR_PEP_ID=MMETSP1392-20130828/7365_1 /ASSEMBLY_ACC=CAM_ASM_000868 /TAXON_ID=225041 /ORGANISM="Chlamydomonas chlamydogama, Strain SAG 11-48b" /LENGTH=445 /DNA_ID=CAMNT_0049585087 /DNA_START=78 /DNA_END=1415 /DNA_ORIENTATION=-